jgi:hypothetical protein
MSIDSFVRRHWFALLLLALHSLLVGAWAWIELDNAWNDMNPTMLVMAAFHIVDYPIHALLQPLIPVAEHTGTYLAAALVLGGAVWFAVGWLMGYAVRESRRFFTSRRVAATHG